MVVTINPCLIDTRFLPPSISSHIHHALAHHAPVQHRRKPDRNTARPSTPTPYLHSSNSHRRRAVQDFRSSATIARSGLGAGTGPKHTLGKPQPGTVYQRCRSTSQRCASPSCALAGLPSEYPGGDSGVGAWVCSNGVRLCRCHFIHPWLLVSVTGMTRREDLDALRR